MRGPSRSRRGQSRGTDAEIPLAGGNASTGVVRVGDTVRKPWSTHSAGVLALMRVLRERGVDLPAPLVRDEQGRLVTEYVPGPLAMEAPPLTREQLGEVGAMIRRVHDACTGLSAEELGLGPALIPVPGADLVCHGDLTPWNLVLGPRWVFIDWDGAALSTRVWDLAYSAQAFALNDAEADPHRAAADLRALVGGYGAESALRTELAGTLAPRARAMHDLLRDAHRAGREPWGSMYVQGHGAHWASVADHVEAHTELWREALLD